MNKGQFLNFLLKCRDDKKINLTFEEWDRFTFLVLNFNEKEVFCDWLDESNETWESVCGISSDKIEWDSQPPKYCFNCGLKIKVNN